MSKFTGAPSVARRVRQKRQTALLILKTAKKLFAEQGFERTTTRSIAAEAGVAIGTVFAHYPDKISLLGQALRGEIDRVLEETFRTLDQQQGPTEQLVHLSRGLLAYYIENGSLSRELIKHATFQEGSEAEAFNEQMGAFVQEVGRTIERAVEDGVLDGGIQVGAISRTYMAVHLFVVGSCLRKRTPRLEEHVQQLRVMVDALLAGYAL